MSKTKVKLDAICAKLKKSLVQPGELERTQSQQDLADEHDPSESLSEHVTKTDPEDQEETMVCERMEKYENSLVGTTVNGVEDGGTDSIPSSRASTPTQCNNNPTPTRTLTGASRRKSKMKVSRVDPTGFETEHRGGPLALSENIDYLSADKLEENISKASISDFTTQGDHINFITTMHRSNGYDDESRSSPVEDTPQDLSIHTVHHRKDHHASTEISHKNRKRFMRDSYDPLAIANFAERSDGHEESDLLIDEGEEQEEVVEEQRSETSNDMDVPSNTVEKHVEPYSSEPEDLSMPKVSPQQRDRASPPSGKDVSSHKVNGSGGGGVGACLNNNNKEKPMYDTAAVREYAANTMKEFLGMYGYEDEHRAERDNVRLDNFAFGQLTQENLRAHPKRPVDAFRARLEQEIRANPPKLDGRLHDELQPQFMHMKLQKRTSSGKRKLGLHNGSQTFVKKMNLHVKGDRVVNKEEQERTNRFSKYDYFIQKLEAGESISHDIPNTRISKYDSYIHQLNQGNSIEKVIGKRNSESQKTLDDINLHLKRKLSSPNSSLSSSPGEGGSRLYHGGQDFDSPGVSLVQNLLPGSPYPILTSIPGLHPLPPMMAGPLTALNLSNRMELGPGPQSGSLPRTSAESSSKQVESSPSGLFKRSLISEGQDEAECFGSEPVKGFSKYIARYAANENCQHCGFHYKEHFHCMETECSFARFTRKEDVMRHYNWHRRRDDSLQHGFMRFSPSDDCSPHYPGCALNFRNTHYHCMQSCNKVYTSTSDVLGHENFHKKNTTLLNEGFQRFRATEDCRNRLCEFYGQKTTHFHCQRHGCDFVFKNKYDIERHKTFHTKDDIYKREGFKKFSKHESCKYESCPYSHMLNHFHCLRPGCNFVFTTANQMHSHKRKHERLERIIRYDRSSIDTHCPSGLKLPMTGLPGTSSSGHPLSLIKSESSILQNVLQSPMVVLKPGISYTALNMANQLPMIANTSMGLVHLMPPPQISGDELCGSSLIVKSEPSSPEMSRPPPPYKEREIPRDKSLAEAFAKIESTVGNSEGEELNDSLNLPIASEISPPNGEEDECGSDDDEKSADEGKQEDTWRKYLKRYTANDPCNSRCELLYKDHYHCVVDNCGQVFRSKESVKKHTRYHFMSEEASKLGFQFFPHGQSCEEKFQGCVFSPLAHYHCMWSLQPGSFCGEVIHTGSSLMRPHFDKHVKNPTLEKIQDRIEDSPEEESQPPSPANSPPQLAAPPVATIRPQTVSNSSPQLSQTARDRGYDAIEADKCPREECPLSKESHFHCVKAECQYATENVELMMDHKTNEKLIFDSFKQCSRKLDCQRPGCKYNMLHKHFHCMHQGCHFSFLQVQQMESHGRKHMRRIYGKLFNRPNSNNPGSGQQFVLPIMSMSRAESPPMVGPPTMVTAAPFYQSLMSNALIQGIPAPHGSTTISWSAIPQPSLVNVTGITPHTSLHNNTHQLMLPISSLAGQPLSTDTLSPSSAYARYGEASSPPSAASPGRSYSPRKRPLTLVIEDPGAPSGYKRYKRGPLDSSMQEKFQRFERSEHCGDPSCQYTLNSTHYHCLHEGCDYRFAGKTMMYKHAQHHDRVDSIIQDDFQRYKSTTDCKRGDCEFGSKSTHFHCLRCPFICTDSGKVAVHRNQHSMSVVAEKNGFKHYSSSDTCPYADCKFSQKSSHFHCERESCTNAIMGLMQMDIHLRNHQEEPMTSTSTAVA